MSSEETNPCAYLVYGDEDEYGRPLVDESTVRSSSVDRQRATIRSIAFAMGLIHGMLLHLALLGAHISNWGHDMTPSYAALAVAFSAMTIVGTHLAFLLMLQSLVRATQQQQQHSNNNNNDHDMTLQWITARFKDGIDWLDCSQVGLSKSLFWAMSCGPLSPLVCRFWSGGAEVVRSTTAARTTRDRPKRAWSVVVTTTTAARTRGRSQRAWSEQQTQYPHMPSAIVGSTTHKEKKNMGALLLPSFVCIALRGAHLVE